MLSTMNSTMISSTTTTVSWSTVCETEEDRIRQRILRLSPDAWRSEVTQMMRRTHPNQLLKTLAFVREMDVLRAAPCVAPASPFQKEPRTSEEVDWNLWQDMVEDPAKYGDDIVEWLELDEKLRAGPKRWRVAAYWLCKEQEKVAKEEALRAPYKELYSEIAKEAAAKGMQQWLRRDVARFTTRLRNAVVTIQAAVRGHLVRSNSPFLNCCMCLAHTVCPLETDHGMMCRACAEQGPHEDITGPVADPWNWSRADYVDLAAKEEEEVDVCRGCGNTDAVGTMDSCPGYGTYCSRKCGPAGERRYD